MHLPFCDVKCAYCDFYSLAHRHVDESFWRQYTDRLLDDLTRQHTELITDFPGATLASVFFGGGTPSKAPAFVFEEVIAGVRRIFTRQRPEIEISAEANPESLSAAVLAAWRSAGINRVSVGMQSLDETVLKYLGRLYNPAAYREVFARLRHAGFTNFNADFITGVPGQSVRSTITDVDFAVGEGVSHVSLYQLTVEPGTLLKQRIESGALQRPSDTRQLRQMEAAVRHLEKRDFHRYEISNFTKGHAPCLHNLIYWTGRPYLGLGVSAHGFTGRRRFFHARSLEKYLAGARPEEDTAASPRDQLINLLRLRRPFQPAKVLTLFASAEARASAERVLTAATERGWLQKNKKTVVPTAAGFRFTDSLLAEFWRI
ncbi:MAG: radical SAM family heme chaperone HemW [Turneriella sp.]|nr:radical SAM family heme chaperone HemW [Turneriella sp.]